MVVVLGDVATIQGFLVIGCERNADVTLAKVAMIVIPTLAIGLPDLERERPSLQVGLCPINLQSST